MNFHDPIQLMFKDYKRIFINFLNLKFIECNSPSLVGLKK
jgi:hypothetical protein